MSVKNQDVVVEKRNHENVTGTTISPTHAAYEKIVELPMSLIIVIIEQQKKQRTRAMKCYRTYNPLQYGRRGTSTITNTTGSTSNANSAEEGS